MRTALLTVVLCFVCCSCSQTRPVVQLKPGYVIPDAVYAPGIYLPSEKGYNCTRYKSDEIDEYLDGLIAKHTPGEIVQVDGLKWKRTDQEWAWEPYPNPPMPVLEEGECPRKHFGEYAEWINTHPHFGYPPLPLIDRE